MKVISTRHKRGLCSTIAKPVPALCLGLLVPIISGVAFGASPEFFCVDTEARLEKAPEPALWMTPISCTGTCFHGPVLLTSQTVPVNSAQERFGYFTMAYTPKMQAEPSGGAEQKTNTPQQEPVNQRAANQTSSRPVAAVDSAQNRFGSFSPVSRTAVHVAQSTRPYQPSAADVPAARRPAPRQTVYDVNSAQNPLGFFAPPPRPLGPAQTTTAHPAERPAPKREAAPLSVPSYVSAQTPFGQLALGHQSTVHLAQNVNELQPAPADQGGGESVSDAPSLGSEPENVGIQFLRTQTVLLKPCQWQFDAGLSYTIAESDFPVAVEDPPGTVAGVVEGRVRQRLLLVPFEARYGLTSRIQLFANAPVGYSNTELTFAGIEDNFTDTGGIGDVSFGLSAQLIPGTSCRPELVGTFAVTAPTGDASLATTLLTPEAALGEGFWGFTGSLLWVRNYDPVVVFYGAGANFRLADELDGVDVDPGERFFYQLGVGFAVNRHVTLSSALIGSYWVEDRWNGVRIPGGIREPLRLRFAATIGKSCRLVEPFAEIGMTEDAPSSRIGITWTF